MISEQDVIEISKSVRKQAFLSIQGYKLLDLKYDANGKDINDAYHKKFKELSSSVQSKEEIDERKKILNEARFNSLVMSETLKSLSVRFKFHWAYYFKAYEVYTREQPVLSASMNTDQLYEALNSDMVEFAEFLPFLYQSSLDEKVSLNWKNIWKEIGWYTFIILGILMLILAWNL